MADRLVFMLPSLLTENLASDDSEHYGLAPFERSELSAASKVLVALIGRDPSNVSITSKKRVKFLMELFGVALSLNIAETSIMEIARKYYEAWLSDSSLFGDLKRQNKYIRRIIKQLSQPFAFNEPKSPSTFSSLFLPMIQTIIEMLMKLHLERGSELELETWLVLLKVSIGITGAIFDFKAKFRNLCHAEHAEELRQKAVSLVFSIIQTSGILDEDTWNLVIYYCRKWSNDLDYLLVWGRNMNELWKYLNAKAHGLEAEEVPISGGMYTNGKVLTDDIAKIEFHNILKCIDHTATAETPALLESLADTVAIAKNIAMNTAARCSTGLEVAKYSAYSFLKLFGRFITFPKVLPDTYDNAISVNITTLIDIIAEFELNNVDHVIPRFIAYIAQRTEPTHLNIIIAFFKSGVKLYRNAGANIPFVSSHILDIIPKFKNSNKPDESFAENFVAIYSSAAESSIESKAEAFDNIFKMIPGMNLRLRLIISAISSGIDALTYICNYLSPEKFKSIIPNSNFTSMIVILVGALVRINPKAIEKIDELKLIPTILQGVQNPDVSGKKGYDRIVLAALQMLNEILVWAPSALRSGENGSALFTFISFVNTELKSETSTFDKKRKHAFQSLVQEIINRVVIQSPIVEHYSRKLNSTSSVNEESVIKLLNIPDPIINYFTIGNHILVSFIETKDGNDPLAFYARGPFGKISFAVSDNYSNGRTTQLSDEIQPSELPKPEKVQIQNLDLKGEETRLANQLNYEFLEQIDEKIRSKFEKTFSVWLDWNKEGYYIPFGYKSPYQRLRVVDFLNTFGIIDVENQLSVRPQKDIDSVKEVIKRFDEVNSVPIVPIPIQHFLANDEDLNLTLEKSKRMTPLLLNFLSEIGEPIESDTEANKLLSLPSTNTSVPAIPIISAFAAFYTPAMGRTYEDAKIIDGIFEKAPFKIIFNESGFDLNIPKNEKPDSFIIVVSPIITGLYNVNAIQTPVDHSSPFSPQQVMSAKTLSFYISIALEVMLPSIYKSLAPPIAKRRGEVIKSLCGTEKIPELAAVAMGHFIKQ